MNDLILLAALMKGPQHGYALKKLAGLLFGQDEMHNNLVYPLLRPFVENSWVVKRTTDGLREQERDLYALTSSFLDAERALWTDGCFSIGLGTYRAVSALGQRAVTWPSHSHLSRSDVGYGRFGQQFVPETEALNLLGPVFAGAGVAFAIWAR